MLNCSYTCNLLAEPPDRYRPGGYHPIHLGDVLGNGRYKIIHKLGWGGFSTVWAARDRTLDQNVAIKVNISNTTTASRESRYLQKLSTDDTHDHAPSHILRYLDEFQLSGPNGQHLCIVTELLGPSVAVALDTQGFSGGRLPTQWLTKFVKNFLQALDYLHQRKIAHGDIHTGNIAFREKDWDYLSEEELLSRLGNPLTCEVMRNGGGSLEIGVPRYLVEPSSLKVSKPPSPCPDMRLIDLGQAFGANDRPETLHTPLALQAPEVVFEDKWDYRVDLWSAGCTIFEFIATQPPFDTVFQTKQMLIDQMVMEIGELPARWAVKVPEKPPQVFGPVNLLEEDLDLKLEEMLSYLYFLPIRQPELTRDQVMAWARIIRRLMKFEPSERASAASVLQESCFLE
ncbi:hypothetical protein N0V90_010682 [Kalmusia sp. IMI 367209]|nr:hypothetical protein N0V90_010682 [Kalmusia sp. IMI 367209]